MSDIVERLRKQAWQRSGAPKMDAGHAKMLEWKAADEIASLRAQLASARKALEMIANHPESKSPTKVDQSSYAVGWAFWNVQHIAKAALSDEQG